MAYLVFFRGIAVKLVANLERVFRKKKASTSHCILNPQCLTFTGYFYILPQFMQLFVRALSTRQAGV